MVSDQFLIFLDIFITSMEKKNMMSLGKSSHIFITLQTRNDKLRQTKEYEVLSSFQFKLTSFLLFCSIPPFHYCFPQRFFYIFSGTF